MYMNPILFHKQQHSNVLLNIIYRCMAEIVLPNKACTGFGMTISEGSVRISRYGKEFESSV